MFKRLSSKKKKSPKKSVYLPASGSKFEEWTIRETDADKFKLIDQRVQPKSAIPKGVYSKKYNRHLDVLPNPATRIKVPQHGDDPRTTYMNANFVRGPAGPRSYVCCQAPLPKTIDTFWGLIWDQEVQSIVMATGLVEKGKEKCERYWPENVGETNTYRDGTIVVKMDSSKQGAGCVESLLSVTKGGLTRQVMHFWYNTWPDHGVPRTKDGLPDATDIVSMLEAVNIWQREQKSYAPVLVHCSAGVGRSGTIIAVDFACYKLVQEGRVDMLALIDEIRNDRVALVQHKQQYELANAACKIFAKNNGVPIKTASNFGNSTGLLSQAQEIVGMGENPGEAIYENQAIADARLKKKHHEYEDNALIPVGGARAAAAAAAATPDQPVRHDTIDYVNGEVAAAARAATGGGGAAASTDSEYFVMKPGTVNQPPGVDAGEELYQNWTKPGQAAVETTTAAAAAPSMSMGAPAGKGYVHMTLGNGKPVEDQPLYQNHDNESSEPHAMPASVYEDDSPVVVSAGDDFYDTPSEKSRTIVGKAGRSVPRPGPARSVAANTATQLPADFYGPADAAGEQANYGPVTPGASQVQDDLYGPHDPAVKAQQEGEFYGALDEQDQPPSIQPKAQQQQSAVKPVAAALENYGPLGAVDEQENYGPLSARDPNPGEDMYEVVTMDHARNVRPPPIEQPNPGEDIYGNQDVIKQVPQVKDNLGTPNNKPMRVPNTKEIMDTNEIFGFGAAATGKLDLETNEEFGFNV